MSEPGAALPNERTLEPTVTLERKSGAPASCHRSEYSYNRRESFSLQERASRTEMTGAMRFYRRTRRGEHGSLRPSILPINPSGLLLYSIRERDLACSMRPARRTQCSESLLAPVHSVRGLFGIDRPLPAPHKSDLVARRSSSGALGMVSHLRQSGRRRRHPLSTRPATAGWNESAEIRVRMMSDRLS